MFKLTTTIYNSFYKLSTVNTKKFTTFGSALTYIIKNRGLSKTYVAIKLGKGKDQISRWAGDKRLPQDDSVEMLEELLSVKFDKLPTGEWSLTEDDGGERAKLIASEDYAKYQVDQLKHMLSADTKRKPSQADALRMIELSESLLRTARQLLSDLENHNDTPDDDHP